MNLKQAKKELLRIRKKHSLAHIAVTSFVDEEYKDLRKLLDQIYMSNQIDILKTKAGH